MQQQKKNYLILSFLTLGLFAGSANAELSVDGYIDAQYNWANTSGVGGANNAYSNVNTFRFSEGALYLTEKQGNFIAHLDLAVQGASKSSSSGFFSSTTGNTVSVGVAKSQAYISIVPMADMSLTHTIGQFDSIFGYEGNDSNSFRYAETGLLYAIMPVTHVGIVSQYDFSDAFAAKLLFANPYDQGHMINGNLDIGLKFMANVADFGINLGVLVSTGDHAADGVKKDTGYIVDFDISATFGKIDAALFAAMKKEDVDNAQEDIGVGLDLGYAFNDMTNLGLRVEYLDDNPNGVALAANTDGRTLQATFGPNFKLSEELTTKLDYTYQSLKYDTTGMTDQKTHSINLAAVYEF